MMINCPKCGFTQPKDKYCANCGVDVDNYVPKYKSQTAGILKNPALHLGILGLFIAAITGAMLVNRAKEQTLQIVDKYSQIKNEDIEVRAGGQIPITKKSKQIAKAVESSELPTQTVQFASASTLATESAVETSDIPSVADTAPPKRLRVVQTEFKLGSKDGPANPGFDHGVFENTEIRKRFFSEPQKTIEDTTKPLQIQGSYALNIGAEIIITSSGYNDGAMRLSIVFPKQSGNTFNQILPENIELSIPKGGSGWISGIIPHRPLTDNEITSLPYDIREVVAGSEFKSGFTEFIVVLEPLYD